MWNIIFFFFFLTNSFANNMLFVCCPPEPQRSRCNDQSAGRAGWDQDYFGRMFSRITHHYNKKQWLFAHWKDIYIFKLCPVGCGKFGWIRHIFSVILFFFVSVAQHHGKSFRERRKTGWPRGKVRTSGKPVQGLLQDCEYKAEISTLGWISLNCQITDCMPVSKPAGTETELLLRNHVMPQSRPHGHASLCLSAFPTTPIMPPVAISVDRMSSLEEAGINCKKGLRVASKCDLGRLWLIGGLIEWWGCSGVEVICIIFKLYKCKHLCGVWIPAEDMFDIVYWWRPVEAT